MRRDMQEHSARHRVKDRVRRVIQSQRVRQANGCERARIHRYVHVQRHVDGQRRDHVLRKDGEAQHTTHHRAVPPREKDVAHDNIEALLLRLLTHDRSLVLGGKVARLDKRTLADVRRGTRPLGVALDGGIPQLRRAGILAAVAASNPQHPRRMPWMELHGLDTRPVRLQRHRKPLPRPPTVHGIVHMCALRDHKRTLCIVRVLHDTQRRTRWMMVDVERQHMPRTAVIR